MATALVIFNKSGRTKVRIYKKFKMVYSTDCNDPITAAEKVAIFCQTYKLEFKKRRSTLVGVVGIFFLTKRRNK